MNNILLILAAFGICAIIIQRMTIKKLKEVVEGDEDEIENLREQLEIAEKIAITDELTGIYNRRQINKLIEHELSRAKRHQHHLQILFLDVDNFKPVNDLYGHDIGDKILKKIAEALAKNLRNFDVYGRVGGDEFVIILPETKKFHAHVVAERIALDVKEMAQKFIVNIGVGVSIGISSFDPADSASEKINANSLLNKADAKMYKQKRAQKAGA